MNAYGAELILDLHQCNIAHFTREHIDNFFAEVCEKTDMEKCELFWWDESELPEDEKQTNPKTAGSSAVQMIAPKGKTIGVQFIMTSNITVHALDKLGNVYINFFSCKDFKPSTVKLLAVYYFGGHIVGEHFIDRL